MVLNSNLDRGHQEKTCREGPTVFPRPFLQPVQYVQNPVVPSFTEFFI